MPAAKVHGWPALDAIARAKTFGRFPLEERPIFILLATPVQGLSPLVCAKAGYCPAWQRRPPRPKRLAAISSAPPEKRQKHARLGVAPIPVRQRTPLRLPSAPAAIARLEKMRPA